MEDIQAEFERHISPLLIYTTQIVRNNMTLLEKRDEIEEKEKRIEEINEQNEEKTKELQELINNQKNSLDTVTMNYNNLMGEIEQKNKQIENLVNDVNKLNEEYNALNNEYNELVPISILPVIFNITPEQVNDQNIQNSLQIVSNELTGFDSVQYFRYNEDDKYLYIIYY